MKRLTQLSTMLLLGTILTSGLIAQTAPHSHNHPAQKAAAPGKHGMMDDKMMAGCHEMMQKRAKMMAEMKEMDEKLEGLVATMNAASGSEKADATAAVVSEMVAQRKTEHVKMAAMESEMMQHMMQHMQMGKESMSMCPMMKGMQMPSGGANKPGDHSKHH